MLANPIVWWASVGGGVGVAILGLFMAAFAVLRHDRRFHPRGRVRLFTAAALVIALAGASAAAYAIVRGPWWRHAPTWALIRAFPTHAPDRETDPVTETLRERLLYSAVGRETRARLAVRCGVLLGPEHPSPVGVKALTLLMELGDERSQALDAVLGALHDPRHRAMVLRNLHVLTDLQSPVRADLIAILADPSADTQERAGAAWTLGLAGPRAADAVEPLAAALTERGERGEPIARMAAKALGRIREAATPALPGLDTLADDSTVSPRVRYTAAVAAACIRGRYATEVEAHADMLLDRDVQTRRSAAHALRWQENPREIGVAAVRLVVALGDEDPEVVQTAHDALSTLVERDDRYADLLRAAARETDELRRERVMEVLAGRTRPE